MVDRRPLLPRVALVLVPTYLLVLLSFALPRVPLDGGLARVFVWVADSGTWTGLPWIATALLIMVVSRPGLGARRRTIEAVLLTVAMLVALALMASINEAWTKPKFAVPRPNIIGLAEAGELGLSPAEFYALGDKHDRREHLRPIVEALDEPSMSEPVREHWIEETGYSFPSGHSVAALTFSSLFVTLGLAWLSGWRRAIALGVPAWGVLVCYSRPLLQVHTPTDVAAGAAMGLGLGLLAFGGAHALIERIAPGASPTPDGAARDTAPDEVDGEDVWTEEGV